MRKTELIRDQLGSVGQVIGGRIPDRLERDGITKRSIDDMVRAVEEEKATPPRSAPGERWRMHRRSAGRAYKLDISWNAIEARGGASRRARPGLAPAVVEKQRSLHDKVRWSLQ